MIHNFKKFAILIAQIKVFDHKNIHIMAINNVLTVNNFVFVDSKRFYRNQRTHDCHLPSVLKFIESCFLFLHPNLCCGTFSKLRCSIHLRLLGFASAESDDILAF